MLVRMHPPPPSRREERMCTVFVVVVVGAGSGGPRILFLIADLVGCAGIVFAAGCTGADCFKADFFFFGLFARELAVGANSSSEDR
jgi:hypothetical protein